jgi:hypothetical protein
MEAGVRYVGENFRAIIQSNAQVVRSAIRGIFDWSDILPEFAFFHEDLATEHLNETGRRALVKLITDRIRR